MGGGEELLNEVLKILCASKVLTTSALAGKLRLKPEEVDLILSALVSEGLLIRVDAGTRCSCVACPVRAWCGIRPRQDTLPTVEFTYYRLSDAGLKACAEALNPSAAVH